jgi:hypothetical protein
MSPPSPLKPEELDEILREDMQPRPSDMLREQPPAPGSQGKDIPDHWIVDNGDNTAVAPAAEPAAEASSQTRSEVEQKKPPDAENPESAVPSSSLASDELKDKEETAATQPAAPTAEEAPQGHELEQQ